MTKPTVLRKEHTSLIGHLMQTVLSFIIALIFVSPFISMQFGGAEEQGNSTGTAAQDGTGTAAQDGTGTAAQDGTGTAAQDGTGTAAQEGTGTAAQEGTGTAANSASDLTDGNTIDGLGPSQTIKRDDSIGDKISTEVLTAKAKIAKETQTIAGHTSNLSRVTADRTIKIVGSTGNGANLDMIASSVRNVQNIVNNSGPHTQADNIKPEITISPRMDKPAEFFNMSGVESSSVSPTSSSFENSSLSGSSLSQIFNQTVEMTQKEDPKSNSNLSDANLDTLMTNVSSIDNHNHNSSSTHQSNDSSINDSNQSAAAEGSIAAEKNENSAVFIQVSPPPSVIVTTPISVGDGNVVSLRDISNTANASGQVSFDKQEYFVGDTVILTVKDGEANLDPNQLELVNATVSSSVKNPGGINILLRETGNNTGIFKGTLTLISGPSSGNSLQVSGTDTITVNYVISHARVIAKIDGVTHGGTAQIKDVLVPTSNQPDVLFTGMAFELKFADGVQLGSNSFVGECVSLGIQTCKGDTTLSLSYANSVLNSQELKFTIWYYAGPEIGWVDLSQFQPPGQTIQIDTVGKTVTAYSPFANGLYSIGVDIGGGSGGGVGLPGTKGCTIFDMPAGQSSKVRCLTVPGGLQAIFANARDPVSPVLNPLLSRQFIQTLVEHTEPGKSINNSLFGMAFAQTRLPTNITESNVPNDETRKNNSPFATNLTLHEESETIIYAEDVYRSRALSLDGDVKNLIISIKKTPNIFFPKNIVLVEGTHVWLNETIDAARITGPITMQQEHNRNQTPLNSVRHSNYILLNFKLTMPGVYELKTHGSNFGTITVLSKGESVDNTLTNAKTPTVGVFMTELDKKNYFDNFFTHDGYHVLSSYLNPSPSSSMLYLWSNERDALTGLIQG